LEGEAKYLEALARCVSAPNPGLAARVLEALLSRRQVYVSALADELKVSYATVLSNLKALIAAGIVVTFSKKTGRRGRPRRVVALKRNGLQAALDKCKGLSEGGKGPSREEGRKPSSPQKPEEVVVNVYAPLETYLEMELAVQYGETTKKGPTTYTQLLLEGFELWKQHHPEVVEYIKAYKPVVERFFMRFMKGQGPQQAGQEERT
jgi:DNA-binding transcriptional ArsR family regulator